MSEAVDTGDTTLLNAGDRRLSWETALMVASPFGVWPTTISIVVLAFASFLACAWWNDLTVVLVSGDDATLSADAWTALCIALLWGSIFGVAEFSRRGNLVDLKSLKSFGLPVNNHDIEGLAFGPSQSVRKRGVRYALLGLCVGTVFYNIVYQPNGHIVTLRTATLTNIWFIVMTLSLFVRIFRNLSFSRNDMVSLLSNLDHRLEIDFFDIGKLDGLGRIALRRALPWLSSSAIVLLMLFGQDGVSTRADAISLFWIMVITLALVAIFVFAAPMWRVHVLIDGAKNAELKKLRRDIAAKRIEFEKNDNAEIAARLSALLALEHHLERVREWPLDLGTIVRFGFYLALPLGSWLGGALVERALNLVTG